MESILKNFDLVPLDALMIIVCALLFVVFWKALTVSLWQPYMNLIEARESATIGAQDGASTSRQQAVDLLNKFEENIGSARISAMEKKLSMLEKAKKEAHTIIEKAEGEAAESVRAVRWQIENSREEVQRRANQEIDGLARSIAERVRVVN